MARVRARTSSGGRKSGTTNCSMEELVNLMDVSNSHLLQIQLERNSRDKKLYTNTAIMYGAGAGLLMAMYAFRELRKKPSRSKQPKYFRQPLLKHIVGRENTPWCRILTFGNASDFVLSSNFSKQLILQKILPRFDVIRASSNYGCPFGKSSSTKGRKPNL